MGDMARGLHSKQRRHYMQVKRQRVVAMLENPRTERLHAGLMAMIEGRHVPTVKAKNAFRFPHAEGAVFPQETYWRPIDFRSENLPMSGYAYRGNRRKYSAEEKKRLDVIINNEHPKMEILGGGGAILAKTGERVPMEQAELIATAAERPDNMPALEAALRRYAVGAQDAPKKNMDVNMDVEVSGDIAKPADDTPVNAVDTTRRPVLKDTHKEKRKAEQRSRAKAKKKVKDVKLG